MSADRSIQRWLPRLFGWVVALYGAWWLIDGATLFTNLIRALSEPAYHVLFQGWVTTIQPILGGDWRIVTSLHIFGDTSSVAVLGVDHQILFRAVMSIPFALALVLSIDHRNSRRIWSTLLLSTLIGALTIATYVGGALTVIVNHAPAMFDDDLLPKPAAYSVVAAPFSDTTAHVVQFSAYLMVLIAPMVTPVLIFVALCRSEIAGFLAVTHRQGGVV